MIVYHGSDVIIERPRILESDRMLDFGSGFYTTTNKEQAIRWTNRVNARRKSTEQFLSIYEYDEVNGDAALQVIRFEKPDEAWLRFICHCRSGKPVNQEYDMAFGPVADDSVYQTVVLYENGLLDEGETIRRLKVQELYNQILFHTKKALKFLKFKDYISLGGNDGLR